MLQLDVRRDEDEEFVAGRGFLLFVSLFILPGKPTTKMSAMEQLQGSVFRGLPTEIRELMVERMNFSTYGRASIFVVFILRGPQGVGKTTLARQIGFECSQMQVSCKVCSADDWFYIDGKYKWKSEEVPMAHEFCEGAFSRAMLREYEVIVIDNTNLRLEHCQWYEAMAENHNYKPVFIEWDGEGQATVMDEATVNKCVQRSYHVPPDFPGWARFKANYEAIPNPENDKKIIRLRPGGLELVGLTGRELEITERGYRVQHPGGDYGSGTQPSQAGVNRTYFYTTRPPRNVHRS